MLYFNSTNGCNIDNFAVGKWFREVYAFRMKREPGENPGQYPLL